MTSFYGKLAPLLRNMRELQSEIANQAPDFDYSVEFAKSQFHPRPDSFTLELTVHAAKRRRGFVVQRICNWFERGNNEVFVLRIKILGDSLDSPMHVVWWFDYPKSIFLSRALMDNVRTFDTKLVRLLQSS